MTYVSYPLIIEVNKITCKVSKILYNYEKRKVC